MNKNLFRVLGSRNVLRVLYTFQRSFTLVIYTHMFKMNSCNCLFINTGLSVPKLVLCMVHINGAQKLLCCFLVVDELTLGDDTGIQYFVPVNKSIMNFVR